ncbi:MAG: lipopolysaccharide biosynthesis protein, partial [Pararhizobium sp.]
LKLLVVVNVLGLAATALGAEFFGPVGAAVAIAATVITWNVIAVAIARNAIGIDPSLLGFLRRRPVLRGELAEGRE